MFLLAPEAIMPLLWVRALELANGRPLEYLLAELETWPRAYAPAARA